ncbi:hypothetical protein HG535_0A05030 [Zygotorulaspora mrakii]|uniref:CMP/dCMP-type deaminase domain-containing protein n=1 Tax=Zygotorulaspora mrakii TaxID=42260 RepID=A0A7H9AYA6_ZYGMR|nr:uncharacterized protein HG535_0A05030 [Zygotorulaspora mrakii]QLG70562.1 hypothetical protein HG535_0A05030 [Zygotorulaspora mrakii]
MVGHCDWMGLAVRLARYALDQGETPVACVFVYEPMGEVIAYGTNDTNGSLTGIAHAEFMAINHLQSAVGTGAEMLRLARSITVYVTVEPCIMCASALRQLGIGKVVFGCANERFGGNGTVLHCNKDASAGLNGTYRSVPGIMRREAIMLLRYFYVRSNERSPKPRNKSERHLDKTSFPLLNWGRYLEESEFVEEFGEEQTNHYANHTDVAEKINWSLVDEGCDDIINELERRCSRFVEHRNKRVKQ